MIESKEIISEFKTLIESSGFDLYGICDAKIPQEDKETFLPGFRKENMGRWIGIRKTWIFV